MYDYPRWGQPEATSMNDEMVFDPAELRALGRIFDETWNAFTMKHPAVALEPVRLRLGSMLLHLARDHQLGQDQIKDTALRLLTHEEPAFLVAC
jgi:hypothetical protein